MGCHDLLCPAATRHALAEIWDTARIVMAPASGHSLSHPAVFQAVKAAMAAFDGTGFGPA